MLVDNVQKCAESEFVILDYFFKKYTQWNHHYYDGMHSMQRRWMTTIAAVKFPLDLDECFDLVPFWTYNNHSFHMI